MNNRILNILKYLLGWPFSIIAFIFILRLILPKVPALSENIRNLNVPVLISGMSCFILYYYSRAYLWHRLLKTQSKKFSFRESAFYWSIAELRRYVPGNVWALLARTMLFSDTGIKKREIGKLFFIEIVLFGIGASTAALLSIPYVTKHFLPQFEGLIQIGSVVVVIALWLGFIFNHKVIKFLPKIAVEESFSLLFLSSIANIFFGVGSFLTITSFIELPINSFIHLAGFFVLSFLLGFSTILTPAGFGVREGITISGLSKIIPVAQSAFGALISRFLLVVSELIFILFIYLWFRTKNKVTTRITNWIADHKHESVLLLLTLVYVIYFTLVSFLRHENFYTGRFDLGNMAQTVWNTTQGRIFEFTNPNGTESISRLAFHADFLLILLAPFYALIPSPKTLLFIQTAVVGMGSVFVYLIAKDKLKSKNLSLAFAFSYLLSPSVQRANLYDFHSVTLATTFLLGTYYFYTKKKYIYFGIFALLAGISKEQIWAILALFGVLIFIKHNKKMLGGSIFAVCAFLFYYFISIAIPQAHGASHFALEYYSEFGDGPISIAKNILFSPQKIIYTIFEKDKFDYLIQLFSPVGYLPLLFPFFLIFAGPDLLINLLSNNPQLHQLYYHYTAAITPFIYISSIFAAGIIARFLSKKYTFVLTLFVIVSAMLGAYKYGPLPGSKDPNTDMFTKKVGIRSYITGQLDLIPRDKSVAASNTIGAHLSNRETIYTLPLGIETADYLVFFLTDSEQPDSLKKQQEQVRILKKDKRYQKIAEKDAFVVFKKI